MFLRTLLQTRLGVRSIEHGSFVDAEGIQLMLDKGTWLVPTQLVGAYMNETYDKKGPLAKAVGPCGLRLNVVPSTPCTAPCPPGIAAALPHESFVFRSWICKRSGTPSPTSACGRRSRPAFASRSARTLSGGRQVNAMPSRHACWVSGFPHERVMLRLCTEITAREFELMVELGMTPMQAIVVRAAVEPLLHCWCSMLCCCWLIAAVAQAGTGGAAELLRLEKETGTLRVGLSADIVGVSEDPLQSVRALLGVRFVMHKGRVVRNEYGADTSHALSAEALAAAAASAAPSRSVSRLSSAPSTAGAGAAAGGGGEISLSLSGSG